MSDSPAPGPISTISSASRPNDCTRSSDAVGWTEVEVSRRGHLEDKAIPVRLPGPPLVWPHPVAAAHERDNVPPRLQPSMLHSRLYHDLGQSSTESYVNPDSVRTA